VTLDGELVCLRADGRPDFARLRHRLTGSATGRHPAMLQVFDALHLDGRSTRSLPYSERRALRQEIALDGPAWRTPASVVVERSEDFLARVEELGLEGVVAKRLNSTYLPGRRCDLLDQTQVAPRGAARGDRHSPESRGTRGGDLRRPPSARRGFIGAGAVELGLQRELVEQLEGRLAELPVRRRSAVAWYPAEVSVVASLHGSADGQLRDAVLRGVLDG